MNNTTEEKIARLYNTIVDMLDALATKVKEEVIWPLSRKDEETALKNLAKINPRISIEKLLRHITHSFKVLMMLKKHIRRDPEERKAAINELYNNVMRSQNLPNAA